MIPMTLADVAAAMGGDLREADPDTLVTSTVEFDSRKITPGGLFVAFPGERVDGHDFAATAVASGAVAVVGTRPLPGIPTLVVEDPQAAMGRLARELLARLPGLTVVAITGSSGKTTTKDLLASVLRRVGPTVAPPGSFNNELGLPYTALMADASTRFLVMEMGSRGVGHIRYLCQIAPPTIGLVLNVGTAHVGEFGTMEITARAKGELVEALPPTGLAVLNADDPRVAAMAGRCGGRVLLAGQDPAAAIRAEEVSVDAAGRAAFTLVGPDGTARVRLGVAGLHQVGNALMVAAVAAEVGMTVPGIAEALGAARLASQRRMDVYDRPDGVTVIDDSYNANPASMIAALRALASMGQGRRTIAVLGYMAELGDQERAGHQEVGRAVAELGIDRLVAVGQNAAPIRDGAASVTVWGGKSVQVSEQADAVTLLRQWLCPGDVVLVKGSRYRTWDVADALRLDRGEARA